MRVLLENDRSTSATIATIGYFDGCHKGHQFVLEHLKQRAAMQGMEAMVVSFTNHPLRYFHPELELKLLTTPEEKLKLFTDYQLDSCLLLPFNEDISQLTSREFMALLAERYGVKHLLVGYDHQFGNDRATTFNELLAFGKEVGVDVEQLPAMSDDQLQISSSAIRKALQYGNVEDAKTMLGYPYFLSGTVVTGRQIGRTLDYPTANLQVSNEKLIPHSGVYAVEVVIEGKKAIGLLNIGVRPTVSGREQTIEVHVLDYHGDLYDKIIVVYFLFRVRREERFETLDALKEQITKDKEYVLCKLNKK